MATATENAVIEKIAQRISTIGGSPILTESMIIIPAEDGQITITVSQGEDHQHLVEVSSPLQKHTVEVTEDETWVGEAESSIIELIEELMDA